MQYKITAALLQGTSSLMRDDGVWLVETADNVMETDVEYTGKRNNPLSHWAERNSKAMIYLFCIRIIKGPYVFRYNILVKRRRWLLCGEVGWRKLEAKGNDELPQCSNKS